MRCQQRARRRCPRGSSDVREADRAPPADADLLWESPRRTSIAVARSACYPGQFIHRARPGSGGGFAVRACTNRAAYGRPGPSFLTQYK